ncbi:MAG: oxidoreductase [Acidobacteria bacterium]|nr:oxidoreductase [Acidobacteriota bacterium]
MEPTFDSDDLSVDTSSGSSRKARGDSRRKAARWQNAEVLDIIQEAPDAITLRLRLEESDGFLPGQYYNVRLLVPDRPGPVQRAYSVGSSPLPDSSIIDLGVREVPGGLVSPRLVGDLTAGDRVEVRGPVGRFTWTTDDGGPVLLVGAGSGVVPLMSMIRYAVAANLDIPMRLVCSSSNFDYAFYHRDLAYLAERFSWLNVAHTFTRDPLDQRASHHRRIDQIMIAEAVGGQFPKRTYVCGPPAMVEDVQKWLTELGVDPATVLVEKYD